MKESVTRLIFKKGYKKFKQPAAYFPIKRWL